MDTGAVLVTGATGYLGSNVVGALVERAENVHVLVRSASGVKEVGKRWGKVGVHVYDGSVGSVDHAVVESKATFVVHLASLFLATHSPGQIGPLLESNILLGTQVLEASANNGVYGIVNTGTSWQHYGGEEYDPVCLYAATKQAFEDIVEFYVRASGLKCLTIKLFDTYGPNDTRRKIINVLMSSLFSAEAIQLTEGRQVLDLLYVDDVVNAYICAVERLRSHGVVGHERYAIGAKRRYSLREVVAVIERATGRKLRAEWGKRPYREREVMSPWEPAEYLPGWEPKVSLEDGVRKVYEALVEARGR
jgi:nucleoside-diphosphate-sugar epimerase